jgi:hypothetical protein
MIPTWNISFALVPTGSGENKMPCSGCCYGWAMNLINDDVMTRTGPGGRVQLQIRNSYTRSVLVLEDV